MSSHLAKAVLYYAPESVWSSSALLALQEKGYGEDELELRVVDLGKGENFALSFLRLNSKATVPTLVVPLQKTLSEDVESRYKAITDPKAIIEFLDKSRSATSRTHTTSAAPAPALAPATIGFSATSKAIIDDILLTPACDPDTLLYLNARDDASLKILAKALLPSLQGRHQTLTQCLADAEGETTHASAKTKAFWTDKIGVTDVLLKVFNQAEKSESELGPEERKERETFFTQAKNAWEVALRDVLIKLNNEVIGPYALGEQLSIADLHLAPWLARLVGLAGGISTDDGDTAIEKLGAYIGTGFGLPQNYSTPELQRPDGAKPTPQSKLAVFWDVMRARPSWQRLYKEGLH